MTGQGKSAIAAEHWLPVYEHLVQGMFHACNNRVAALSGISQLYDAQLSSGAEGMQQLAAEVVKLRELMSLCRAGSAARRTWVRSPRPCRGSPSGGCPSAVACR